MELAIFLLVVIILAVISARSLKNNRIIIGKPCGFFSKILNEERKIWIYVPQCAEDTDNKKRYPVIYLFDGDKYFAEVTGMVKQLSEVNGDRSCPEMIVVGIPHKDRLHDLTPTHSMIGAEGKTQKEYRTTGGGDAFIDFVEKELIPHIDAKYQTTDQRILVGQSVGGLAVMNIMVNYPGMFNEYIAIEPSMWWDNRKILKQAEEAFTTKRFDGQSLYLGIANTRPNGMDIAQMRQDTTGRTNHGRSVLELADLLKSNPGNGLRFSSKYYHEHNHGSVPLSAIQDGLLFLTEKVVE